MNLRILLVEDEPDVALTLSDLLTGEGYVVDTAPDGAQGLERAASGRFDLIVLDVMLPKMSGFEVCRQLRQHGKDVAILMLTARSQLTDRVVGLRLGADDYLVKPFAFSELLARVRTILRRPPVREAATLRVADLELDLVGHKATRAGQWLDLTVREFTLLSLLMRHAGEVLTRTLIAESVWNMHSDGETNVVDVNLRRLRAKLDDPFAVKLLRTVRGVGYVLEDPQR